MGAGASVAASMSPMTIFGLGVAVGAAWAGAEKLTDVAFDALDAVDAAAEAVTGYLRAVKDAVCSAAAWALEKLKEAAASVLDRVVRLLRRLRGRKEAAAAKREVRRAAARRAGPDVYAEAASRVARSGRCITTGPAASLAVVAVPAAAAAAHGALALRGSDVARRAARSAAGMMGLILEALPAGSDLGGSIPAAARSFITVIATAAAVCLDVVASTDANV